MIQHFPEQQRSEVGPGRLDFPEFPPDPRGGESQDPAADPVKRRRRLKMNVKMAEIFPVAG